MLACDKVGNSIEAIPEHLQLPKWPASGMGQSSSRTPKFHSQPSLRLPPILWSYQTYWKCLLNARIGTVSGFMPAGFHRHQDAVSGQQAHRILSFPIVCPCHTCLLVVSLSIISPFLSLPSQFPPSSVRVQRVSIPWLVSERLSLKTLVTSSHP